LCIGTASISRLKIATVEAIFWQAIVASAIRTRTTSLHPRSKGRPRKVALARTNRSNHPSRHACATIALALCKKKRAPQRALVQKVEETSRRQGERRLRTCPLKRSGGLVKSKLAVNLLVASAGSLLSQADPLRYEAAGSVQYAVERSQL
jgi:hypothetical protein